MQGQTVILRVRRSNPDIDQREHHYQDYHVPVTKLTTVLEGLLYIRERLDSTVAVRYSCRMASCGSCGMVINDLPRLACRTRALDLGTKVIKLDSSPNFPLVRDLVTDLRGMFRQHKSIKPFLIRKDRGEQERPTEVYKQSQSQVDSYVQFSWCIECGLCVAACPTSATDGSFLGPQALAQAYRWTADSRDEGKDTRLDILDTSHGIWRCHFAGACSRVCPKGVDPALAIQLLKGKLLRRSVAQRIW